MGVSTGSRSDLWPRSFGRCDVSRAGSLCVQHISQFFKVLTTSSFICKLLLLLLIMVNFHVIYWQNIFCCKMYHEASRSLPHPKCTKISSIKTHDTTEPLAANTAEKQVLPAPNESGYNLLWIKIPMYVQTIAWPHARESRSFKMNGKKRLHSILKCAIDPLVESLVDNLTRLHLMSDECSSYCDLIGCVYPHDIYCLPMICQCGDERAYSWLFVPSFICSVMFSQELIVLLLRF